MAHKHAADMLVGGSDAQAGPIRDYSPILAGPGKDDYARYMKTDVLLSLQRDSSAMLHHDEMLFQVVHQSTELWLKLACFEVAEATREIASGRFATAPRLMGRASHAIELITGQLEMLSRIAPQDFQRMRPALGNGSGFESPGWKSVKNRSEELERAHADLIAKAGTTLLEIYQGDPTSPAYLLCEALVEWDERVALWRSRHYKVAVRTLGHGTVGTKGMPVDQLTRLLDRKFFPDLWEVRTRITEHATVPLGCAP